MAPGWGDKQDINKYIEFILKNNQISSWAFHSSEVFPMASLNLYED